MKKRLSILVCATALIGLSQLASAADDNSQNINGQVSDFSKDGYGTADINVNGTLGAANTDPNAPIDPTIPVDPNNPTGPQKPNPEWINVTVPTTTIFYNTVKNKTIKSPNYTITNNSGRPVDVAINSFTLKTGSSLPTASDFNLNLEISGGGGTASYKTTSLITDDKLVTSFADNLITLANNEGKLTKSGVAMDGSNIATFIYSGSATVTEEQKSQYTLNLKFTPVTTDFDNN